MEDIIIKESEIREKLSYIPYNDRIIFLPDCLRSNGCTERRKEYGVYNCSSCEQERDDGYTCPLPKMIKTAKEIGYKDIYIVGGNKGIVGLLESTGIPKAVLGVACPEHLKTGIDMMDKVGIEAQVFGFNESKCAESNPFNNINDFKNEWFNVLTRYPPSNYNKNNNI